MAKVYKFLFLALILVSTTIYGQNYSVTGVVTNSNTGEKLVGANVYVKSLNIGGVSDINGIYVVNNVPAGNYAIKVSYIGYKSQTAQVNVSGNVELNFKLEPSSILLNDLTVEVNRAQRRKTPVSFTTLDKEQLSKKYTTQDIPDLLSNIPGVFTNSAGMGESQIYIRGFDAEHIQVLINGVPTNDPESQVVYWSNWSGLAGNATSIQVQKGVGASLVGSGSFGGSVNIQTSQYSAVPKFTLRTSTGIYATRGILDPNSDLGGKSADGTGGFNNLSPSNTTVGVDYTSGQLYGGKLNIFLSYERKTGDSYLAGTNYNGHSFYLGLQSILGNHLITINVLGAPQRHRQSSANQELGLLKSLGREYSRRNSPYQENYFFKPQYELHDSWSIKDNMQLSTNAFYTTGHGGGRYLRNDFFNINTGEIGFKDVSDATDAKEFGRNARFIFEQTGIVLTGYNPTTKKFTYNGVTSSVSRARNIISSQFGHSWRNDSQSLHKQSGINTAFSVKSQYVTFTFGGEYRHWRAEHTAQTFDFRKSNGAGGVKALREVQRRYDYDGIVNNSSGFARMLITPIPAISIMLDVQYAKSSQRIEEIAVPIYDFVTEKFIGQSFFATKNSGKFVASDYERDFDFWTPKFGANFNVTKNVNLYANYSVAKKEPRTGDWYNRASGPNTKQKLTEETLKNLEFGFGYSSKQFSVQANYYYMWFKDKIERVTSQTGDRITINAGNAIHKGFELSANAKIKKVDASLSLTASSNKWDQMNVKKIFGIDASKVVGKVVPFSPENQVQVGMGISFTPNFRVGVSAKAWNNYFGTFDNTGVLPNYYSLNADLTYNFMLNSSNVTLRLNVNNITNQENISRASFGTDFGRTTVSGITNALQFNTMKILQAPLRSAFLTAIVNL